MSSKRHRTKSCSTKKTSTKQKSRWISKFKTSRRRRCNNMKPWLSSNSILTARLSALKSKMNSSSRTWRRSTEWKWRTSQLVTKAKYLHCRKTKRKRKPKSHYWISNWIRSKHRLIARMSKHQNIKQRSHTSKKWWTSSNWHSKKRWISWSCTLKAKVARAQLRCRWSWLRSRRRTLKSRCSQTRSLIINIIFQSWNRKSNSNQ